jgi:hypothetical protein
MGGFLAEVMAALVGGAMIEIAKASRWADLVNEKRWSERAKAIRWSPKKIALYALGILAVFLMSDLTPIRIGETVRLWILGLPQQEKMVAEALRAFERGELQAAIERSRAVIEAYEPSAKAEEKLLESQNVPKWSVGTVSVTRAWQSMAVFARGSLNSVALSWWIMGRSQQKLGQACEARASYEACASFSHARTWDPQFWPVRGWSPFGWFWAPPEDAQERARSIACAESRISNGRAK